MGNTKLGFMNVPNGDAIAFDMKESEINPSVVYLSHDDGEGHGYILGKDFNTYLEQLLLVGACGNEDWQMLPFCLDAQSGIVSDCENAKGVSKTYRVTDIVRGTPKFQVSFHSVKKNE